MPFTLLSCCCCFAWCFWVFVGVRSTTPNTQTSLQGCSVDSFLMLHAGTSLNGKILRKGTKRSASKVRRWRACDSDLVSLARNGIVLTPVTQFLVPCLERNCVSVRASSRCVMASYQIGNQPECIFQATSSILCCFYPSCMHLSRVSS